MALRRSVLKNMRQGAHSALFLPGNYRPLKRPSPEAPISQSKGCDIQRLTQFMEQTQVQGCMLTRRKAAYEGRIVNGKSGWRWVVPNPSAALIQRSASVSSAFQNSPQGISSAQVASILFKNSYYSSFTTQSFQEEGMENLNSV